MEQKSEELPMPLTDQSMPFMDGVVAAGVHWPVTVSVELLSQQSLEVYYGFTCAYEGQIGGRIRYCGHKEDMVDAGCIDADKLKRAPYDQFIKFEHGFYVVASKAGRGYRGRIAVSYYVDRLALVAPAFPSVASLFPKGIPHSDQPSWKRIAGRLPARPKLQLVVDNTRGGLDHG